MKSIIIGLGLILIHQTVIAQYTGAWKFGGPEDDNAESVIQTTDGGYMVAGTTKSFGAGERDFFVIKYNASFQVQWQRSIGGIYADIVADVVQTNDGGYIIGGQTYSFGANPGPNGDIYFVKLNPTGTIQWTKTIAFSSAGNSYESIMTMRKALDGTVLAGGLYVNTNFQQTSICRINQNGTVLSSAISGESSAQWNDLVSIYPTSDGGYATVGVTSPGGDFYKSILVKYSSTNTVQWGKQNIVYPTSPTNYWGYGSSDMIQTYDGGYVTTGYVSSDFSDYNIFLAKYSSTGTPVWVKYQKNSQGTDSMRLVKGIKVIQTVDSGYAAVGLSLDYITNRYHVLLNRYDVNGNMLWSKRIGDSNLDHAVGDLIQASDGGFVIAASEEDTIGWRDFYIIKTDLNGNSCQPTYSMGISQGTLLSSGSAGGTYFAATNFTFTGTQVDSVGISSNVCSGIPTSISIGKKESSVYVFPNPFNEQTTFVFSDDIIFNNCSVSFFDMLGRKVKSYCNVNGDLKIPKQELHEGVFFYRVVNSERMIFSGKLIVQ